MQPFMLSFFTPGINAYVVGSDKAITNKSIPHSRGYHHSTGYLLMIPPLRSLHPSLHLVVTVDIPGTRVHSSTALQRS